MDFLTGKYCCNRLLKLQIKVEHDIFGNETETGEQVRIV